MRRNLSAMLALALVFLCGCGQEEGMPAAKESPAPTAPLPPGKRDLKALGLFVPITPIKEGDVKLDGDVAEWGAFNSFLDQSADYALGPLTAQHSDAAAFSLRCSDTALYFAINVVDKVVHNPFDQDNFWQGDCVEVFFDLRPLTGDNPIGTLQYTPGVYQFLLAPPHGDQPARSGRGRDGGHAPQNTEVAGKLTPTGYRLELRIPLAGLKDVTRERLDHPIGFDVMIDDVDPQNGKPSPNVIYSWSGSTDYSRNASIFAMASTQFPVQPRHIVGPRMVTFEGKQLVSAAIVTSAADRESTGIELKHEYKTSPFDQTVLPDKPMLVAPPTKLREAVIVDGGLQTSDRPELGMRAATRSVELAERVGGRYSFTAKYAGSAFPDQMMRRYIAETQRGPLLMNIAHPFTRSLAQELLLSWATMQIDDLYPPPGKAVSAVLNVWMTPDARWMYSELMDRPGKADFKVRLQLKRKDDTAVLWTTDVEYKPGPINVDIPTAGLKAGVYMLHVLIADAQGNAAPVQPEIMPPSKLRAPITVPLSIMEPYDRSIKATVTDAPQMLTQTVLLGNPNRERFAKDDGADSLARSTWDLHAFDGRIYIGCGDWDANRGPIDVWSFAPTNDPAQVKFEKEFTVDDESIDIFRDYGGRLYVPGIDAREPWTFGNLYIRDAGKWVKRRTIPNGLHVLDAAEFNGKLYVGTGTESGGGLFWSTDGGASFTRVPCDPMLTAEGRFFNLLPMDGYLLTFTQQGGRRPIKVVDDKIDPVYAPVFPGVADTEWLTVTRLERLGKAAVYTIRRWYAPGDPQQPLFVIDNIDKGARSVDFFADKAVRDIVVHDGKCHVMTSKSAENNYFADVYVSDDLAKWTHVAHATMPTVPQSLEFLDGNYFIGLASREYNKKNDPDSGAIYVLK